MYQSIKISNSDPLIRASIKKIAINLMEIEYIQSEQQSSIYQKIAFTKNCEESKKSILFYY